VTALLRTVADPTVGGTVVFCGTVRAAPEDGPVVAIEYSAYDQMAETELSRIVAEVAERWGSASVALQHRLGRVSVGEASIVIAVAAPHRAEAFEVCRYVIDEVKLRVPIWKKEFLDHGEERWRSNESSEAET
jgi:molybdopterin synthase catalytic subunit